MVDLPPSSRRGFLKAIGLGAAAKTLPPAAEAAPAAKTVAPVTILPESRVAGSEKHLSVAERLLLQPGQRLAFRRDTANRYDKRAIAIDLIVEGEPPRFIGFVPRHENKTMSDLIDDRPASEACSDRYTATIRADICAQSARHPSKHADISADKAKQLHKVRGK
jgi:hypothetical protein